MFYLIQLCKYIGVKYINIVEELTVAETISMNRAISFVYLWVLTRGLVNSYEIALFIDFYLY